MHETIFNQKQVLQGTIFYHLFLFISYCKYNNYMYTKVYEVLKLLQFLDIEGSISDSNIYMP